MTQQSLFSNASLFTNAISYVNRLKRKHYKIVSAEEKNAMQSHSKLRMKENFLNLIKSIF